MEPRRICEACSILAATRDHMESEELTARIRELSRVFGAHIYPMETPNIDISSNMIRERVHTGRSIRYYVPEAVEEYIYKKGLYCPA